MNKYIPVEPLAHFIRKEQCRLEALGYEQMREPDQPMGALEVIASRGGVHQATISNWVNLRHKRALTSTVEDFLWRYNMTYIEDIYDPQTHASASGIQQHAV